MVPNINFHGLEGKDIDMGVDPSLGIPRLCRPNLSSPQAIRTYWPLGGAKSHLESFDLTDFWSQ